MKEEYQQKKKSNLHFFLMFLYYLSLKIVTQSATIFYAKNLCNVIHELFLSLPK